MAFSRNVWILLWKNLVTQKRKKCVSIFEILLPLLFALLLVPIRLGSPVETYDFNTIYEQEEVLTSESHWRHTDPTIFYLPTSPATDDVMSRMNGIFHKLYSRNISYTGFSTHEQLLEAFDAKPYSLDLCLEFHNIEGGSTRLPQQVALAFRPGRYDRSWRTGGAIRYSQGPSDSSYNGYGILPGYQGGLLVDAVNLVFKAVMQHWNSSLVQDWRVFTQRMPYPPYVLDHLTLILKIFLPLFFLLSFLLSVIMFTKAIVYEKQQKLKESLRLMGVSTASYWTAWFITCSAYMLVVIIIYTIIIAVTEALPQSSTSLVLVFLLVYSFSLVSFCFMVSVFVHRANLGAVAAALGFIVFFIPYWVAGGFPESYSNSHRMSMALLFNTAMAWGVGAFVDYEEAAAGAKWSNFYRKSHPTATFSVLDSLFMMAVDSGLHLGVTWYVDNVYPGEFGVPKPWNFPFLKSFWFPSPTTKESAYTQFAQADTKHFEKDPPNLNAGIVISDLTKTYSGGKVAVAGMSLTMYEDQITVLLGHNGAGKTTTMSVLTGFLPPTSGTAVVNGYDIRSNIDQVRETLGLCPQHNILFDLLTVREHLYFFAKVKGVSDDMDTVIADIINDVSLTGKENCQAQHLSGGQKRKLSVAIALIGGSKVVILDEPSSGMDPAARRQMWDVLQRHKRGRTIVLSTHAMDEADTLGDRIAIMAEGVLKCCGTSMFLKKLYGAGYHLIIVKGEGCQVEEITDIVRSMVPGSEYEEEVGSEISYSLPADQSALFPSLFTELDSRRDKLGISGFGTKATTMEEVFLRVGDSAASGDTFPKPQDDAQDPAYQSGEDSAQTDGKTGGHSRLVAQGELDFNVGYTKKTGVALLISQLRGQLVKKMLYSWRGKLLLFLQLLIPLALTAGGVAILNIDAGPTGHRDEDNPGTVPYDLSPFDRPVVLYTDGRPASRISSDLAEQYAEMFRTQPGTVEKIDRDRSPNVSEFLLDRMNDIGFDVFSQRYPIGAEFLTLNDSSVRDNHSSVRGVALYNDRAWHGKPLAMVQMLNAFIREYVGDDYSIQASLHPMPPPTRERDLDYRGSRYRRKNIYPLTIFLSLGMGFLLSSFVYILIVERQRGCKHLQEVSGVNLFMYWLATFLWDFFIYLLVVIGIIAIFLGFDETPFIGPDAIGPLILLFLLYGFAASFSTYVFQFLFKSPPTGFVVTLILHFVLSLFTTIMVAVIKRDSREDVRKLFSVLFLPFNLNKFIMDSYNWHSDVPSLVGFGNDDREPGMSLWDLPSPGVGLYTLMMAAQGGVAVLLLVVVENRVLQKLWYSVRKCGEEKSSAPLQQVNMTSLIPEDSDVAQERQRILHTPIQQLFVTDSLILKELSKNFGELTAVDGLCVGVPEQECLGLLGQNGAGKTTTFKMLTGQEMVSGGNAYVKTHDIRDNTKKVQSNMGYCPQFDALTDQLTGRETLTLYSRIKGIPEGEISRVCDSLIDALMLRAHADKLVGEYSGGNKRKLSTALSLVGDPAFLLLDEPSSGMDPGARRQLWTVLSYVRASGRTLVLTSHSMEECDALCTRIAIMINGRFMCLGSPQQLKNKFGQGYTLIAQMEGLEDGSHADHRPVVLYIQENVPSATVFDYHQGYIHIQVPDMSVSLAQIFSLMESSKKTMHVRDYSVHQTTLEQVFLSFARFQRVRQEEKKRCCRCC